MDDTIVDLVRIYKLVLVMVFLAHGPRRSLLRKFGDLLGDRRHNLRSAAPVPYDSDSLASVIASVVPLCCMEYFAAERFQSRKLDLPRNSEAPYGSEEYGAGSGEPLFSPRVNEFDLP